MTNPQTRRWQALNPAIYLISILPGLAVVLLARQHPPWISGLSLATFAVVLLQHAINVFNDLSDWRLGADIEKSDSWVRFHRLNLSVVAAHGSVSFIAGGLLGLYVLQRSSQYWILAIAVPLVMLGYLYNSGSKPLSYSRAGEWVTASCYGPGVFGCLWLVSGQAFDALYVLGSVAFAALSLSLLLSHQPPQIDTDRKAGKFSYAVRHGSDAAYRMSRIMLVISSLCLLVGLYLSSASLSMQLVYLITSAALIIVIFKLNPQPKIIMLGSSIALISTLIIDTTVP